MMKKFWQLVFVIAVALMFFSCVKGEINYECKEIKEGVPTIVTLKYHVQRNKIVTRAAQSEESEYRVGNLYVFIFDENGNKHEGNFYTSGAGLVTTGDGAREGTVSFSTTTLNHATIVGIANVTIAGQVETAYTITEKDLDGVNTLNDLKKVVMKMETPSVERTALFMMTGYARTKLPNGQETTDIQIGGTESGSGVLDCTLELDRTDAKVTFNVVASPANTKWREFVFTPNEWFVYEVPKQSLLLPADEGAEKMDADGEYFTWGPSNFEEINEDENTYGFTFYMPENRKAAKREVPNYAARDESEHEYVPEDERKPGQEYENGLFTYADEHATYVILTGVLSYVNESGQSVNADVRYIIHLGYASKDPSDFDTKRNVHYTYNVTIKGVSDIVVEVTSENDNEVRPGYEGDVVYSANQIFNLDAHYDRCQLVINKSAIDGMTWGVKTPFSSGIHAAGATEVEDYLKDYQWIKFAINADFNAGENQFVKYPGDSDKRLMDVHQLIERLKDERNDSESTVFGSGNNVYITAFVEENVYFTNPNNGQEDLLLWKESVDKDDRLLHIITDDAVYSADGNSSVVNSLYTFKQKAVRTVFDVNNPELKTAWGLESVMETSRLPMFDNSRESMSDYRDRCL